MSRGVTRRGLRRALLAVCILATIAVIASLFLRWYGLSVSIGTGIGTGEIGSRAPGDAWRVVPGTAILILAASILTLAGAMLTSLKFGWIGASAEAFGALAALGVIVWRTVVPPSPMRGPGIVTARFTVQPNKGGHIIAVIAAGVAFTAGLCVLATTRRGDGRADASVQAPGDIQA